VRGAFDHPFVHFTELAVYCAVKCSLIQVEKRALAEVDEKEESNKLKCCYQYQYDLDHRYDLQSVFGRL
jgi:hypothetical protein